MRFYPRNRKSRHDALIGPNHVDQHPSEDELTRRDRLHRYERGNDAAVAGAVTKNETDVVHGSTAATQALTSTLNYTDGDTVTINGKVYTIQAALTNVDGHVKRGASEAATILNLHHAINAAGGTPGTDYALATTANADVTATDDGGHVLTVTAKIAGVAGDAITTTTTSLVASWGGTTLAGGYDAVAVTMTVSGDDLWQADAVTSRWQLLINAVPTTDGLRTAVNTNNFTLSADHTQLTLTLPAIGGYTISADANYALTFDKTLFLNAHDTIVVNSAINIVNGA